VSQILPSTELLCHGFAQSCSDTATQKLQEKVMQHEEVVESSKTGCRSQLRALGPASACIDQRHLCPLHIVRTDTIWGVYFDIYEQNNPPKYLGNESEISHLNFTTPRNFGLHPKSHVGNSKPLAIPTLDRQFSLRQTV